MLIRKRMVVVVCLMVAACDRPPTAPDNAKLVSTNPSASVSVTGTMFFPDPANLGGVSGSAEGINNRGWVVGYVTLPNGNQDAFIMENPVYGLGRMGTLGLPPILQMSAGFDINDKGEAVGWSPSGGPSWAFMFFEAHGTMNNLGGLPGLANLQAFAVNNNSEAAGYGAVVGSSSRGVAVIWNAGGEATLIGALGPTESGAASDINDNGEVVGSSFLDGRTRAFIWSASTGIKTFMDPPPFGASFDASAINNNGQITGSFGNDAYIWSASTGMKLLGRLEGSGNCQAYDINNARHVTGFCNNGRAFLWSPATGMINIGPGMGKAINDNDQVVGNTGGRNPMPFVWTPDAPLPSTPPNEAPVIATIAGATILAGETFVGSGSFTDPDDDHWGVTVEYGDGSASQSASLSGSSFSLTHTYSTAGSYIVTVAVADDDVASTATFTVTVQTPVQAVADEVAAIANLVGSGTIPPTAAQSLVSKLEAAMAATQPNAAVNEMNAFINKVNALLRSGRISSATASELIDAANRIIAAMT